MGNELKSVKTKRKLLIPARKESTDGRAQSKRLITVTGSTETATATTAPAATTAATTTTAIDASTSTDENPSSESLLVLSSRIPRRVPLTVKKKKIPTPCSKRVSANKQATVTTATAATAVAATTVVAATTAMATTTVAAVTKAVAVTTVAAATTAVTTKPNNRITMPVPMEEKEEPTEEEDFIKITKIETLLASALVPTEATVSDAKMDDDENSTGDDEVEIGPELRQITEPESCPTNRYNTVQDVVVASNAKCQYLAKRCRKCRGCGIVEKIIQLTQLICSEMQPECVSAGDVYDFNAEIVEAITPSLSCMRNQSRQARAVEEESHLFMDLLPEDSPHIIQITLKRTAESQCISKACIVKREVMANTPQPSLIEHENLLDRLLECLSSVQNQPKKEPQPSTSGTASVEPPDVILPALRSSVDDLEMEFRGSPELSLDAELTQDSATDSGQVLEAPIFYPTAEEFTDPISYYEKIAPTASKFGLCKIVAPPGFSPPCVMDEQFRFAVIYQYISKLYSRWGPASRELAAIKAHMRTQSVAFARSPLLDGSEVNLPKLHHAVQRNGGPTSVIQRKRWGKVAEEMKLTKLQNPERKLDQLFMRYLLPYTMLSNQERQKKMVEVEKWWTVKYQKMLERARNPFHRQKRLLGESDSSEDEIEDNDTSGALDEAEDCIVQGRIMNLATFTKIATSLMEAHFEAGSAPSAAAVEAAYWRAVLHGTEHIVANTASIDTGEEGYGFPKDPSAKYGGHPWNLKRLSQNPNNVLRFLGPVLGVTVPTLHLSMLFSTSCWHRDPHGLPWTEYMHSGPEKIWYGIPGGQSGNFRRAVETLCPAYCQSKSIWLASDIAMIPPDILSEHNVTLSRVTQKPGEYIMVFPEAHSCSITTGFAVSESVYFATNSWLDNVGKLFEELRNSCEPTMFSLEQLLMSGERDQTAPRQVLPSVLATLLYKELTHRAKLERKGLQLVEQICELDEESQSQAWTARNQDECEFCRSTLYFSKVIGLTGRKSLVCPAHAILMLDTNKYRDVNVKTLGFVTRFSSAMLQELWERLTKDNEPIVIID